VFFSPVASWIYRIIYPMDWSQVGNTLEIPWETHFRWTQHGNTGEKWWKIKINTKRKGTFSNQESHFCGILAPILIETSPSELPVLFTKLLAPHFCWSNPDYPTYLGDISESMAPFLQAVSIGRQFLNEDKTSGRPIIISHMDHGPSTFLIDNLQ
jgi:hypothetical protein